ncbi:hypothetical protein T4C_2755 [Trichinella pseudospiralis]|uniref:Uncharacterized protein n=1 Tax=Trichinella pseudospiralis TaxID=6337 RepID=A0A0V1K5J5_TRIPS|nr:hypothetical protein T4C_2755 [Trichinella pseudospiralis]
MENGLFLSIHLHNYHHHHFGYCLRMILMWRKAFYSFYSSSKADKVETLVIMYNNWPPYARKSLTTHSTKGTTRLQHSENNILLIIS